MDAHNRPSWDEYFLDIAALAAKRSHDIETQVGCVLVRENRIIGVGYNGFCRNTKDHDLPKVRPDKYPFIVHAEQNAIVNSFGPSLNCHSDITAYITHYPCTTCAKLLWQFGAKKWVVAKNGITKTTDTEEQKLVYEFLQANGLVWGNLDWGNLGSPIAPSSG